MCVCVCVCVTAADGEESQGQLGIVVQAASLLLLPFQVYSYFFPSLPTVTLLADRSIALLLVLVQNCRSNGVANPYRSVLCSLSDDTAAALSPQISFGKLVQAFGGCVAHAVCGVRCAVRCSLVAAAHPRPNHVLWCALCGVPRCCDTPLGAAAFYTMLHGNPAFLDYVLAVTDIELLVGPICEQLYVCFAPPAVASVAAAPTRVFVHRVVTALVVWCPGTTFSRCSQASVTS